MHKKRGSATPPLWWGVVPSLKPHKPSSHQTLLYLFVYKIKMGEGLHVSEKRFLPVQSTNALLKNLCQRQILRNHILHKEGKVIKGMWMNVCVDERTYAYVYSNY